MKTRIKVALITSGLGLIGVIVTGLYIKNNSSGSVVQNATQSTTVNVNGKQLSIDDLQTLFDENKNLKDNISSLQTKIGQKEDENQDLVLELNAIRESEKPEAEDILKDVKLIIDSVEIGSNYMGTAKNGELLLSTNALSEYLGKPVTWDAKNNTVYVGDKAEKIAKDITLWDKPYLEVGNPAEFTSDIDEKIIGIQFNVNNYEEVGEMYYKNNFITYGLNGKAKKISGTFCFSTDKSSNQTQFTLYNENDEAIFTSPILTKISPEYDFSIDVDDVLKLKIMITNYSSSIYAQDKAFFKDLTILTTDY